MTNYENLQLRIAWGITGAGHFLSSCVDLLLSINTVDIFASKAAEEVLSFYGLYNKLKLPLYCDDSSSYRSVTKLYTGKYDLVVIAPATSNSIAKMANGIADNLISNLFAHAGKCRIPILLLPCDSGSELKSITPDGKEVSVCVREIDKQNIERLSGWDGIIIANNPQQLKKYIDDLSKQKNK